MKRILTLCITTLVTASLVGCDSSKPAATKPAETKPAAEEPADAKGTAAKADKAANDFAEVSREGTKFDPPVAKAKIPPGAHYCDMGTVHYARMERGDGKCPECGMMLTLMPADAKAGAAKKDDHGHGDHAHGDHDHGDHKH